MVILRKPLKIECLLAEAHRCLHKRQLTSI
jgi:hypothetical protein